MRQAKQTGYCRKQTCGLGERSDQDPFSHHEHRGVCNWARPLRDPDGQGVCLAVSSFHFESEAARRILGCPSLLYDRKRTNSHKVQPSRE